jgi:hypothetical protein
LFDAKMMSFEEDLCETVSWNSQLRNTAVY